MREDDQGRYGIGAFLSLLIVTSLMLVFCAVRLWKTFRASRQYRPLQVFYVALGVFLICRFLYFLSPFADYPTMLYYTLNIPPVALINCITGIVCYIW